MAQPRQLYLVKVRPLLEKHDTLKNGMRHLDGCLRGLCLCSPLNPQPAEWPSVPSPPHGVGGTAEASLTPAARLPFRSCPCFLLPIWYQGLNLSMTSNGNAGLRRKERDCTLKELWELANMFRQQTRKHQRGWIFGCMRKRCKTREQGFIDFVALSQEIKFNTLERTAGPGTNYLLGWLLEA